ncbi:hemagglutinin [Actinomyces wuliandei]|uniref:hemagglutinin n=1 Tax=Actinomyces wuliandei TaxID=2057743 RepID=UPI0027D7D0EB|nr:hemagglutinin [Actinomyces wuliandei]
MSHSSTSPRPRLRRAARSAGSPRRQRRLRASRQGVVRRRPSSRRGPSRRSGGSRRFLHSPLGIVVGAFLVTVLVALLVLRLTGREGADLGQEAAGGPAPVAPDTEGFDATHLIDDEVFYDSEAMSLAQVEAFISEVNSGCVPGLDGTACLAQATFEIEHQEPSSWCPRGVAASSGSSAALVVWEVARACDVNPQVLLVLIHKEQGLLTASGASLSARDYEAAAGYGCPDGADCDGQWSGFFLQLYGAASQFQRYRLDPGGYDVVAGVPVEVSYSPRAGCGSAELRVANQATAGLYNYTPFQPNAAVSAGGDDCTSWGNWNFYGYFRTFFGDPTPSRSS